MLHSKKRQLSRSQMSTFFSSLASSLSDFLPTVQAEEAVAAPEEKAAPAAVEEEEEEEEPEDVSGLL